MRSLLQLFLLLAVACTSLSQELDRDAIESAVRRGLGWMGSRYGADGRFDSKYASSHSQGVMALGVLTMLKAGMRPDHPVVANGFDFLRSSKRNSTYDVALTIMALEARYKPTDAQIRRGANKSAATLSRNAWRNGASKADKKLLSHLVQFLVENQKEDGGWRYPGGEGSDNSATQYAMLGLKASVRLGVKIPAPIFQAACDRWLALQQDSGAVVTWFPIPAADGPIDEYKKPRQRRSSYFDMETEERPLVTTEDGKMRARGFGYTSKGGGSGAMTAAGLACLIICKSELESRRASRQYWRENGDEINRAIRDAAAWLAHKFSVEANPSNEDNWLYYYIYGLERAGMMMGTYDLGPHNWYTEGALSLLEKQRDDGSWKSKDDSDAFVDTCFALLFLKRATVPVLKVPPPRELTGAGNSGAE